MTIDDFFDADYAPPHEAWTAFLEASPGLTDSERHRLARIPWGESEPTAYEAGTRLLRAMELGTVLYPWGASAGPRGPGRTGPGYADVIAACGDAGSSAPLNEYEASFRDVDERARQIEKHTFRVLELAAARLEARGVEREAPPDEVARREAFMRGGDSVVVIGNALGVSEDVIREASRGTRGARSRWGAVTRGRARHHS